jgi:hypothetical protein
VKECIIENRNDFDKFASSINNYFESCDQKRCEFKPFKIITKKLLRGKTRPQHLKYWATINELKKAFYEVGYIYNQEQLHELIKREAGFTEVRSLTNGKQIIVAKSIADNSEDADIESMKILIEFIKEFAIKNLNYYIED